jgi:putative salt-induced outer membrane protein
MRPIRQTLWATGITLAAGLRPVAAQVPDSFRVALDLGYVNTAGNTDVTTLNFGENLTYKTDGWSLNHGLVVIEGRSGGAETAAQYRTGARVDRAFSARFGAYAMADYERNVFAGIARRYDEGAGLTAKVIARPRDLLDAEAGLSFIQQRNTTSVDETFGAGRGAVRYKHSLTDAAAFQQLVELLANLQNSKDQRINSETSLTAPLSKHIAMKAAYLVRYDNQPEPGFKKSDRVFTTGIQIVF